MKKRVAIITPGGIGAGYFSQGYPPLVNFIKKLSREYDITVYSIHAVDPDFVPGNFNLRTISRFIVPSKIRSILLMVLFLFDHIRNSYSLIHSFWIYPAGTLGVVLGKVLSIPSMVTVQGGEAAALPQINYGNMTRPWKKKITLWTCEKATCLNSISQFLADELNKHGLKRKDAVVIPFGPERTIFNPVNKETESECLRIIHVANLTEVKDQVTLLKAFDLIVKHQTAELRIIGEGTLSEKLKALTTEMRLDHCVKFFGVLPNKELPQHYAWADIMLHTSLHEGQSGVVMEAMSSGVVVCATRVGVVYDLGEKFFVCVNVGDYKELASQVINIWKNQERFNEVKKNALQWALTYDASWTASEYRTLYKTLLK
jgi:glycosyltransferase involved in cell wall biosynthesis